MVGTSITNRDELNNVGLRGMKGKYVQSEMAGVGVSVQTRCLETYIKNLHSFSTTTLTRP